MNVVRVKTKELYLKSRYLTKTVSYWQWCLLKEKVEKDGKVVTFQKTVKLKKECTVRELVDTFNDEFRKDFCRLIFNIRHQFQQASKCKAELCYDEAADFFENCSCKIESEIQSMHFGASHEQATLHTVVVYYENGEKDTFCTDIRNVCHIRNEF